MLFEFNGYTDIDPAINNTKNFNYYLFFYYYISYKNIYKIICGFFKLKIKY